MNETSVQYINPEGYRCFACGTANPIGLKLKFYKSGSAIGTRITLGPNYVGWENMSHGGIISTILDETMSWAILYFKRLFFVTRKIEVKYIRPILVGTSLVAKGVIVEGSIMPKIQAKAELRDSDGHLLARSTGEFIALTKDEVTSIPEGYKEEMFAILEKLPPV